MTDQEKVYLIGASCWLLSDLLSDAPNMALLRNLKEIIPDADYVALASLHASKVAKAAQKYERDLTSVKGMKAHYPDMSAKELKAHALGVTEQFALSADYLYNWLTVAFKIPSENFGRADDAIIKALAVVQGKRKADVDIALEWIANYPEGHAMRLETVRNKLIEIKNREV